MALWDESAQGRGAAANLRCDQFESHLFSLPYFDRDGLILAWDGDRLVGLVHAGFGSTPAGDNLQKQTGVICAIAVHPEYRNRGIGRNLIERAESYLRDNGAVSIFAGPSEPLDPFFFGLYGGAQPSGFLVSDKTMAPFLKEMDYVPFERHGIFQRDITEQNDPVTMRLVNIRRKMQLAIARQQDDVSWWWVSRYGRMDSVRFQLVPKGVGSHVAGVTVLGLDFYLDKWEQRAIGLTDLLVEPNERQQGYGQALLLEVCRRMREEMVTLIEAHAAESNLAGVGVLESAGFKRVDTGVVYQRIYEDQDEQFGAADETTEFQVPPAPLLADTAEMKVPFEISGSETTVEYSPEDVKKRMGESESPSED